MAPEPPQRSVTYFYTGTGNSFRVATWLHEQALARGYDAELLSVEHVQPREAPATGADAHLTVVFPTHALTAPWKMIKVAFRLARGRGATAFVVATRAGMKFGPVHPPGMGGTATFLIALILALKGYRVRGALSVNMPSNWFSLHPMQSRDSHAAVIERGRGIVERATARIFDGRRVWLTRNNLYELIIWRERSGCGTEIPIAKRVLRRQYLAFCSAYVLTVGRRASCPD